MHLTLDYRMDWRAQAALFRLGDGLAQLRKQAGELRLKQLVWVGLWLAVTAAALHWRAWAVAVPAGLFTTVLAVYAFALRSVRGKAALQLRGSWRQTGSRPIRLEIVDGGLRETDADVASFAPWHTVKSYWSYRRVLCVELTNGQSALIAVDTLAGGASQVEAFVAQLRARDIPARQVGTRP